MPGYDRAVTIFSPNGHLLQVEYAQEAVRKGSTVVAIRGENCIVMGVEKRAANHLQIKRTLRKIWVLDEHAILAYSGLTADARIVINRAQVECQSHRLNLEEPASLEYITKYIAAFKQKYTQSAGMRPFGLSCLIGGFDADGMPHLFQTEPSGIYYEWRANALGRSANTVRAFLEKHFDSDKVQTEEATAKLAIRALLEVGQLVQKNLEIAVIRRNSTKTLYHPDIVSQYCDIINKEKLDELIKLKPNK